MNGYYEKREGFNPPDKKAPRFKKSRLSILSPALFASYKKKYPDTKLDYKQFKHLILSFNRKIRELVVTQRDGVELPEQLGYLFIGSCPKKKENPNYHISAEYNKKINHRNWESNQYVCKIFYSNYGTKYKLANREYWYFKASRTFKLETSEAYIKNWNLYRKISPVLKISSLYAQGVKSIKVQKHDYNNRRTDFSDTQPG